MDISDIVSTEYVELSPDTPVSKLGSRFEDPSVKGALVTNAGEFEGVVTRRQLAASHHPPEETVGSLAWPVSKVSPGEGVREVARLMRDSEARLLPVFENQQLSGVVRADDLLERVQPYLDAAAVADVYTTDIETVESETTFGEALNILREHQERRRGTPLLFARVRLDTDCGLFVATGEGYGAENAIREALDALAKQLRERDTYAESKKHPSEEFWEKRFGWWLEA